MSTENKYFSENEINNFKKGSLPFPYMVYDGVNPDDVIEVTEVISIGGMADNNGIPNEIVMYNHRKNEESKRLVYRLVSGVSCDSKIR